MSNYNLIRKAIEEKLQVTGYYKGLYREMCPHTLGKKNGKLQALFFQFGGQSSSGLSVDPKNNWRCIPVNELTAVSIKEGQWYSAANHSRPQTCVGEIDVEISF